VKFYFITDPLHASTALKALLQQVYELYVDYVVRGDAVVGVHRIGCLQLKNPFYTMEQPIRCDKFDSVVEKLITGAQA
jgi:hypothetical protein